ncbi:MAG: hypothetical protein EOM53_06000, partial [Alphaproteobacteria bacterium]|nr:hypothetical protein [Alphaproteobacteria bacterium]
MEQVHNHRLYRIATRKNWIVTRGRSKKKEELLMKNEQTIKDILDAVGGQDNVKNFEHCA